MRDLHFLDGGCGGVLLVDLALWLKRVGEVWQITLEDPLKHKGWQRPFEFWEVADVTMVMTVHNFGRVTFTLPKSVSRGIPCGYRMAQGTSCVVLKQQSKTAASEMLAQVLAETLVNVARARRLNRFRWVKQPV